MKKTLLLLALLIAARTMAQSNGDPAFFYYVSPGIKDSKTYASLINDGLFATNNVGGFELIAKSSFLTPAQGNSAYQPLNATLTALAALTTTSYGRGLLSLADAAAARTYIGAGTGSGDVVGPASAVDGHIVQFDGTTGKLIKDGLATSTGGNGAADDGDVLIFRSEGQIHASVVNSAHAAVYGESSGTGYAGYFSGANGSVTIGGGGGTLFAGSGTDIAFMATSWWGGDIAQFTNLTGQGMNVGVDGGASWTTATGAQTTATNLPTFGTATKGVVPASGGGTTNYLRADGTFAAPAGTGIQDGDVLTLGLTFPVNTLKILDVPGGGFLSMQYGTGASETDALLSLDLDGADRTLRLPANATVSGTNTGDQTITLTGDVTGSGTGSFATTLATVNATSGTFGTATAAPTFTVNGKGLITFAGVNTITPAVGSITGLGTNVATWLATPSSANLRAALTDENGTGAALFDGATSPTFTTPALGTPSALVGTNITGTATGLTAGAAQSLTTEVTNRVGADFTTNSTTLVDVTDGAVAMVANADYTIEIWALVQSSATTTGVWLSLDGPASPTSVSWGYAMATSTTAAAQRFGNSAYNTGSATNDIPAANTTYSVQIHGMVRNGANAGNLQLRLAAETAANVKVMEGTWMKITRTN